MILTVCVCNGMRSWKNRSGLKQGRVNHTFETSLFIAVVQKKKCCEKRAGGEKREDWAFYFRFACVIFATSLTSKNLAKASLKPRVSFYFKKLTLKPPSPSSSSPPPLLIQSHAFSAETVDFWSWSPNSSANFGLLVIWQRKFPLISTSYLTKEDWSPIFKYLEIDLFLFFFSYFTSRGLGPISSNYRVP